jgi:hypothetical protein
MEKLTFQLTKRAAMAGICRMGGDPSDSGLVNRHIRLSRISISVNASQSDVLRSAQTAGGFEEIPAIPTP